MQEDRPEGEHPAPSRGTDPEEELEGTVLRTDGEIRATLDDAEQASAAEGRRSAPPPAKPGLPSALARLRGLRRFPFVQLAVYYLVILGIAVALIQWLPVARRAFVAPVDIPALSEGAALLSGSVPPVRPDQPDLSVGHVIERGIITLLVTLGALSLVFPVAWVYMFSKRLRYDPALVRSVIILPVVVAGITLVVKNSLALAFSLAGIVAAVRFRNTLKDPRDAVYIFLTIGIGLSAGVQALDVALVMSVAFNLVVLLLWKYNIGSIYGGRYGRTGILSVGDSRLLMAQSPDERRVIRRRVLDKAARMKTDGILLVHSDEPEIARHTVQEALGDMAKEWRLAEVYLRDEGRSTLEYLLRLKKKALPVELMGSLDDRWSSQVDAAEYIPFRTRKANRP
jgi:hypothetical protein